MTHDATKPAGSTPGGGEGPDVVVVGAGLAGLVAAVTAARAGSSVQVLESGRPGGRARTTTVDPGVVFNAGPRALYLGGAAARELAALGVTWTGGVAPTRGARATLGTVSEVMPGTPDELLRTRLLGLRSKVQVGRLLGSIAGRDPATVTGRTVARWLDDLGLRPDAAALVHAVVRLATYTDAPTQLDAGAALAQLQLALGEGVMYLDHGWQPLVDQLADALVAAGGSLVDHVGARSVRRAPGGGWLVDTSAEVLHAGAVVLAVGTPTAAAALSSVPLAVDGLGDPVTAACLELAVRGTPPTRFSLGIDRPLYLSQHAPPARLAADGISVVHVLRNGATEDADADRAELRGYAAGAGIGDDVVLAERFLRRMVVSGGMPLASAGGLTGRPGVRVDGTDGLFLAGDWVGAEGLLADAAAASGRRAGELATAAAARRPAPAVAAG